MYREQFEGMHTDAWVYMVNCNSPVRIILFLATTCMSKYDLFHVNVKKILYQKKKSPTFTILPREVSYVHSLQCAPFI